MQIRLKFHFETNESFTFGVGISVTGVMSGSQTTRMQVRLKFTSSFQGYGEQGPMKV
jgi:hypothetical protein